MSWIIRAALLVRVAGRRPGTAALVSPKRRWISEAQQACACFDRTLKSKSVQPGSFRFFLFKYFRGERKRPSLWWFPALPSARLLNGALPPTSSYKQESWISALAITSLLISSKSATEGPQVSSFSSPLSPRYNYRDFKLSTGAAVWTVTF